MRETPTALKCTTVHEEYGKIAFRQEFRLPNGNVKTFFLFKAKDKPVIIFPLTVKNEVVAVKHFRYGANDWVMEVPGGVVEGDVTEANIKKNAKRELCEETGYTSDNIVLVGKETWFDPASFRVTFYPMLARECRKVSHQPTPEKTEFLETCLIPFEQWVEKIKGGEICDSKTIAITMMVLCYLKSNFSFKLSP